MLTKSGRVPERHTSSKEKINCLRLSFFTLCSRESFHLPTLNTPHSPSHPPHLFFFWGGGGRRGPPFFFIFFLIWFYRITPRMAQCTHHPLTNGIISLPPSLPPLLYYYFFMITLVIIIIIIIIWCKCSFTLLSECSKYVRVFEIHIRISGTGCSTGIRA